MSNLVLDNKLWAAQSSAPSAFHSSSFGRRIPAPIERSRKTSVCDRTLA